MYNRKIAIGIFIDPQRIFLAARIETQKLDIYD